jgi:hypothetical protein
MGGCSCGLTLLSHPRRCQCSMSFFQSPPRSHARVCSLSPSCAPLSRALPPTLPLFRSFSSSLFPCVWLVHTRMHCTHAERVFMHVHMHIIFPAHSRTTGNEAMPSGLFKAACSQHRTPFTRVGPPAKLNWTKNKRQKRIFIVYRDIVETSSVQPVLSAISRILRIVRAGYRLQYRDPTSLAVCVHAPVFIAFSTDSSLSNLISSETRLQLVIV